jgi:hypothetical protein
MTGCVRMAVALSLVMPLLLAVSCAIEPHPIAARNELFEVVHVEMADAHCYKWHGRLSCIEKVRTVKICLNDGSCQQIPENVASFVMDWCEQ